MMSEKWMKKSKNYRLVRTACLWSDTLQYQTKKRGQIKPIYIEFDLPCKYRLYSISFPLFVCINIWYWFIYFTAILFPLQRGSRYMWSIPTWSMKKFNMIIFLFNCVDGFICTCITLISSLSAYPSPPDTSHAYSLQAVSMNPADYSYSRKSHNRIHRYAR